MFIPKLYSRPSIIGYLFWRRLFRKNGKFVVGLENYFFGQSHGLNDYEALSSYKKSHAKPDKQYSILPTVLKIIGNTENKTIVDLGCGTGFFTIPLAENAKVVYGIDNSETQLSFAEHHPRVTYIKGDIFIDQIPFSDVIVAPFVVNYSTTVPILKHLFKKMYDSLSEEGKIVIVVDLPNNKKLERFGASKKILGATADEASLQIDIFNGGDKICTLYAVYFTPETIQNTIVSVGFKNVCWHKPIVSKEGLRLMSDSSWCEYLEDPELGYITAIK